MVRILLMSLELRNDYLMEAWDLSGLVVWWKQCGVRQWTRVNVNAIVFEIDRFSLKFNLCFWELVEFQYFSVCIEQRF